MKNLTKIDEKFNKNQKFRTDLSRIYYGFLGLNVGFFGVVLHDDFLKLKIMKNHEIFNKNR
jgi:hypothetical protein